MKVTLYDNYHAGVAMLPKEEQDAFYGAVARYAFEGEEPELEGIAAAIWATIKTLVDKSLEAQENGAKGGNGRGNKTHRDKDSKPSKKTHSKTQAKTHSENPSAKPLEETQPENQINKNKRKGKENLKDFLSISNESDGACAQGAPPASIQCPTCGVEMEPTNSFTTGRRRRIYRCPLCATTEEVEEDGL